MTIDLFTLAAQIVNFVILILLLKHFLYDRIIRVMDSRQQRIADRLEEAQNKKDRADEEMRQYRAKKEDIDGKRDEILAEAREEADRRREEMVEEARREVDDLKKRWTSAIERDRDSFLRHLRQTAAKRFHTMAGRALSELAESELEDQMAAVFTEKVRDLESEDRSRVLEAIEKEGGGPTVRTSFGLSEGRREDLTAAIKDILREDIQPGFKTDEDLICGIELEAGGVKVSWSLDTYLDELEERVSEILESKVDKKQRPREGEESPDRDEQKEDRSEDGSRGKSPAGEGDDSD